MIQNTIELMARTVRNVSLSAPSKSASCQIVSVTSAKAVLRMSMELGGNAPFVVVEDAA